MSFNLFQWLRELIDHLEKHPQAEQIAHPVIAAVASAATVVAPSATPKDGQAAALAAYRASGGHVSTPDAPVDHSLGFDFGPVPNGEPRRNYQDPGQVCIYTFTVTEAQKMRLTVASDLSMGKPIFDNFSLTIKSGDQVVDQHSQPANSGASYLTFGPFQPGSYTMDFSVDKRDLVVLKWDHAV